jgi:hypothetical protein
MTNANWMKPRKLTKSNLPRTAIWRGASGQRYEFQVQEPGAPMKTWPGIYAFCRWESHGEWTVLSIGTADCFVRRLGGDLARHPGWSRAREEGATHIALLPVINDPARSAAALSDLRLHVEQACMQAA